MIVRCRLGWIFRPVSISSCIEGSTASAGGAALGGFSRCLSLDVNSVKKRKTSTQPIFSLFAIRTAPRVNPPSSGQFGFFLGLSIITLLQMILYGIHFVLTTIAEKAKKVYIISASFIYPEPVEKGE